MEKSSKVNVAKRK